MKSYRCVYISTKGDKCAYIGMRYKDTLCPKHQRIMLRRKFNGYYVGDPSAPWCTCHNGCKCGKPSYNEWGHQVSLRNLK